MSTLHAYARAPEIIDTLPLKRQTPPFLFFPGNNNKMNNFLDALQKYDKCMKDNKGEVLNCYLQRKKLIEIAMNIKPYKPYS